MHKWLFLFLFFLDNNVVLKILFPPPIQKSPKLTAVLKSIPEIIPGRSAVSFRSDHQEKQTKGGRAHRGDFCQMSSKICNNARTTTERANPSRPCNKTDVCVRVFYSSSARISPFGGKVAAGGKWFQTQFNFHLSRGRVCYMSPSLTLSTRNLNCVDYEIGCWIVAYQKEVSVN